MIRFDLHIKQISFLKLLLVLFLNVAFNTYSTNIDSLYRLGLSYYNNAEYKLAIEKFQESILLQKETGDSNGVSKSLNIKIFYLLQKKFFESFFYFKILISAWKILLSYFNSF